MTTKASPLQVAPSLKAPMIVRLAILLAALEVIADALTWVELNVSIIYILPLVLAGATRNRRLVWGLAAALLIVSFAVYFLQFRSGEFSWNEPFFLNRVLAALTILVAAGLIDVLVLAVDRLDGQTRSLRDQQQKMESMNRDLMAYTETIVQQNQELNSRWREAEDASDRKTRLLASVSHDIRAPLNTIGILAELIRGTDRDQGSAELPQLAEMLQANVTSLADLVSDVLEVSALHSGRAELHPMKFSLNELLDAQRDHVLPQAQTKALQMKVELPVPTIWLFTDRPKLDRIVGNLLSNAVKYTQSGLVTLGGQRLPDGGVEISVHDTGGGIAPADQRRIFDEFAQLDNPQGDRRRGWGLGLAICRRLIELIGGRIAVQSELGRGSTFTVHLPRSCVLEAEFSPVAEQARTTPGRN